MRQRLNRLVAEFVNEPALIRNKIAHGQWVVALNRERTAVNQEVTSRIEDLDIVVLDRWFECAKRLAEIVEALVESPDRHFRAAYWELLTQLETDMDQMSSWTRTSRIATLRRKRTPRTSEAEGLPGQQAFAAAGGAV
jgi:hypothetical protein